MSTFGKIDAFDGNIEPWEQYMERMDQYFLANNITDETKRRAIFLTSIGTTNFTLLRSLASPKKVSDVPLQVLINYMNSHCTPRTSEIVERFRFNCRTRHDSETISSYVAELRRLAEHCNFGETLDTMLRDRLVCGVNEIQIQKRLLSESSLTLKKATDIAIAMETAVKHSDDIQKEASTALDTVHYTNNIKSKTAKYSNSAQKHHKATTQTDKRQPGYCNKFQCIRCGSSDHKPKKCPFSGYKCNSCGKQGHLAKMCITTGKIEPPRKMSTQANKIHTLLPSEIEDTGADYQDVFQLRAVKPAPKPMIADFVINGVELSMEIDSGAAYSIIHKNCYIDHCKDLPALEPTALTLKTYTGDEIKIAGSILVEVKHGQLTRKLQLLVVEQGKNNLCGRDWIHEFQLFNNANVSQVTETCTNVRDKLAKLLKKHEKVFEPVLGCLKDKKVHLKRKPDIEPKFFKPRTVPYAYKKLVSDEIDRLVTKGILSPIGTSEWAAPIVPVLKKDKKSIRICGDFKLTANLATSTEQYPLPRVDDLHASLAGGKKFSKLDMSDAYNQLMVDDQSSEVLVINTEKGLFRYNRLPFGISSASAVFQRELENVVGDVPRTSAFQDDLLVTGTDDDDHLNNLDSALTKIGESGLKLRKSKCEFLCDSVEYLGHRIDAVGIHPTDEKIEAISQAPTPSNVDELRAFIGLLTYYSKFIPNMSTMMAPLYKLTRDKEPWSWEHEQSTAFAKAKSVLSSNTLLVHYDQEKELSLFCDASPYGIGAVLSHVENGLDKPVAYASRTLSAAEGNYSHIEREALALVFAVTKFRSYLLGRHFTLVTDHKPLTTIFSENKSISTTSSSRMQRWAITLAAHDYAIKYRRGIENANADALSRLPIKLKIPEPPAEETVLLLETLNKNLITAVQVKSETERDPTLTKVAAYVKDNWPSTVESELKSYWSRRHELSTNCGMLTWHNRAIIPPSLRAAVLAELHDAHVGMTRMKRLARSTAWWPNIDKDIVRLVEECATCQRQAPAPKKIAAAWPDTNAPWSRIHLDYAGPIDGYMLLIVVDPHTNWIEVAPVTHASSVATADEMRLIVARYGIPSCIVTDNATSFTGVEFQKFVKQNNIRHITTAPYHPYSNGPAERAVRTIKEGLSKLKEGSIRSRIARILFSHRRTPTKSQQSHSPFQDMIRYDVKSRLDLLVRTKIMRNTTISKKFSVGDKVWIKNFSRSFKEPWIEGEVKRTFGATMYEVDTANGFQRRHVDQIRSRRSPQDTRAKKTDWDITAATANEEQEDGQQQPHNAETSNRYPTRIRH